MDGADTKQFDARIVGAEEEGVCILGPSISNQYGSASHATHIVPSILGRLALEMTMARTNTHTVEPDWRLGESGGHDITINLGNGTACTCRWLPHATYLLST